MRYTLTYGDGKIDFNTKVEVYCFIRDMTGQTTREIINEKNRLGKTFGLPSYIMVGRAWMVIDNTFSDNMFLYENYFKPLPWVKPLVYE